MKVGDLVTYRHGSDKTQGVVLYVQKQYINSGKPERARVYWSKPFFSYEELDDYLDWVDDLEVISEGG